MSKIPKFNAFPGKSFWPNISCWLEQLDLQQEPKSHMVAIDQWWYAFLDSHDADDHELRCEVKQQYLNLNDLFTLLECYPQQKRQKQLNKYLQDGTPLLP